MKRFLPAIVSLLLLQGLFVTSVTPATDGTSQTSAASVFIGPLMPYEAFEKLPKTRLEVGKGALDVAFAPGKLELPQAKVLGWIAASAHAVATYYGRFPVPYARVLVVPREGNRIRGGKSFGYGGAAVRVGVGQGAPEAALQNDWVMTHEMVHLAFPSMRDAHLWIEEGIATYVEPIARAQAGQLSAEKVWGDLVKGIPQGLPEPGDRGLDHTPTWGRIYWGGALFCLLADVEIRQRTGNRRGLQDALRGIVAAGGNIETHWPIERTLKAGDEATGIPVLTELYERMKAAPVSPDLGELWRSLGVEVRDGAVVFNDGAPLASIRRAITAAPSGNFK